jgi:hypothetical protein
MEPGAQGQRRGRKLAGPEAAAARGDCPGTAANPGSASGHFAGDAQGKFTIRKSDFDAALDRIVTRRLAQMAEFIKQDTAAWLAEQGITDGSLDFAGGSGGPRYALRNGGGIWKIVFDGRAGEWKDEKGLHYAAHLLKHPPAEPIHGAKLAARVFGCADIAELSLGQEDATSQRAIETEAKELAAVLKSDGAAEFERQEARERLEELARIRKQTAKRPETNAEKTVRAVRKAIRRLHENLARRKGDDGKPHPVFAPFAAHLQKYLLIPSARYSGRRGARVKAGVAGGFIYEPPDGVVWEE